MIIPAKGAIRIQHQINMLLIIVLLRAIDSGQPIRVAFCDTNHSIVGR